MIDTLIFDLDDTLLDDAPSTAFALRKLWLEHAELQVLYSFDEFVPAWNHALSTANKPYHAGEYDVTSAQHHRLEMVLQRPMGRSESHQLFSLFESTYVDATVAFEETKRALDLLQDFELHVMSNSCLMQVQRKLQQAEMLSYFQRVFTTETSGRGKPHAQAYVEALRQLRRTPQQVVFIGDSLVNDVQEPMRHGCYAVHLDRQALQVSITDKMATIPNLGALPDVLSHWQAGGLNKGQ